MAAAAIALTVASMAMSAYGKYQEGQAASEMMNYRSQVAANNKKIAEQYEGWEQSRGAAEESANAMKQRAGIGRLRANMAASGVRLDSGSSADVLDSAVALGELDTLTIRSNTARKMYGYRVAGQSEGAQSGILSLAGSNAESAGGVGALGSLLSGASSVAGKYAAWQNVAPKDGSAWSSSSSDGSNLFQLA